MNTQTIVIDVEMTSISRKNAANLFRTGNMSAEQRSRGCEVHIHAEDYS